MAIEKPGFFLIQVRERLKGFKVAVTKVSAVRFCLLIFKNSFIGAIMRMLEKLILGILMFFALSSVAVAVPNVSAVRL
ncbi:MAG: hypothetical protein LBJ83_03240 [Oscillospiraceae bacterium]|jgi:hypothetical protein|nr:hypothetical protein [Oscillospiraceae bacterium]